MPNRYRPIWIATATVLLGIAACSEEPQAPKPLGDDLPAAPPATQATGSTLLPMADPAAVATNMICPVSGEEVEPSGGKVTYQGITYGFCCDDCIDAFQKEPQKFVASH